MLWRAGGGYVSAGLVLRYRAPGPQVAVQEHPSAEELAFDWTLIAKRLINLGTTNPLAKRLTQLGRLVKTTYLLRYLDDMNLRQVVELMLNRGEGRQNLAQHVFFANQGRFRSGDYFEIMNKANCLSLLSNAIIVWNTIQMGGILEAADREGKTFSAEALAHVQPLHFKHIIVNGTYDFSGQTTTATA